MITILVDPVEHVVTTSKIIDISFFFVCLFVCLVTF